MATPNHRQKKSPKKKNKSSALGPHGKRRKRVVVLHFHTTLYTLKGLRRAACRFAHTAHIEIAKGKPYHEVKIAPVERGNLSSNRLAAEYANHALAATIESRGK